MINLLKVASGYGIAHLGEHGRDKAETGSGEQLGRLHGGKETGSGGSSRD